MYTLKNEFLTVKISEDGAQIMSIFNNKLQKEYLWNGDAKFWNRCAPILFPIVGALKDKKYLYNNNTYSMSQHGFARDSKFELESISKTKIVLFLKSNENTKKVYPFDFTLKMGIEIVDNKIKVTSNVYNDGEDKMYFSIGAHPAFLCDLNENYISFNDYDKDDFSYKLISSEGCLIDKEYKKSVDNGVLKLNTGMFDNDALIIENNQLSDVSILDKNMKEYLKISFKAPVVGLWSPAKKNAPFLCIEPWHGRCDRMDSDYDFTNKDWINILDKNESFLDEYYIEIK